MRVAVKTLKRIQVGLYKRMQQMEIVWLDQARQIKTCVKPISEAKSFLFQSLSQDFGQGNHQVRFIAAISSHLIWHKTLILPQILNEQECRRQCRFVLNKALPIPLDELWFDYTSHPLKQGFRLDLYALRQQMAAAFLEDYSPFVLDCLDVTANAIFRAFHYLLKSIPAISLLLYIDEQFCLAVCERIRQRQVLQLQYNETSQNPTALVEQFRQRYPEPIEQIYVYRRSGEEKLPEQWQPISTSFPFIALGNALWQQDLT